MNIIDLVVDLPVTVYPQNPILYIFSQIIGIGFKSSRSAKLIQTHVGFPFFGVDQFYVILIVNNFSWKSFPLHEIHQVGGDIHYARPLLTDIIKPCWTDQRLRSEERRVGK